MKVVLFCGGQGLRLQDGSSRRPQAADPGGRPAHPHAPHEVLRPLRAQGLHPLPRATAPGRSRSTSSSTTRRSRTTSRSRRRRRSRSSSKDTEDWRITFVDTGRNASCGERLRAVRQHLAGEEYFLANYGDALTDAALNRRIADLQRVAARSRACSCVKPHYSTHTITSGRRRARDRRAHDGRRLAVDQRRLLRLPPGHLRLPPRGRGPRRRAVRAPDRRRPARGRPLRGLLGADGHPEGQAQPRHAGRHPGAAVGGLARGHTEREAALRQVA